MRRVHQLLIDFLVGSAARHRRDWRRLWRYCRCGYRWRCPDSIEPTPMPYAPKMPPLARTRTRNTRDPLWNSPSGRHQTGRVGALTPGQAARARGAERARSVPR